MIKINDSIHDHNGGDLAGRIDGNLVRGRIPVSELLDQMMEDGVTKLDEPLPATEFSPLANEYDFYGDAPVTVTEILFIKDRMAKEVFYIPALIIIALIFWMQFRRRASVAVA